MSIFRKHFPILPTSQFLTDAKPIGTRYLLPVVLTALIVACVYCFSPNFRLADTPRETSSPYAGDFLQEWLGGYIVRAGDHSRFYETTYAQQLQHNSHLVGITWDESRYFPIVYPPFYYLLLSPLSALSFYTASWIWTALMVSCFATAIALLYRSAAKPTGVFDCWRRKAIAVVPNRQRVWQTIAPWTIPAAVLFAPMVENLSSSQKGAVCLLILTGTFLLLYKGRPYLAGLVFGLLAFKPQLTLVIAVAMMLKQQWRFVFGGATTGAVLVGLSLLVGIDVCRQYFQFAISTADYIQTSGYDLSKSHCLYGFFALLAHGEVTMAVRIATLVFAVVTIGLLALTLQGQLKPDEPRFALQFSGLVVATVLLSSHFFTYDLVVLLLPMFLLGFALVHRAITSRRSRWMIWILVLIYKLAGYSPQIAKLSGIQMTTLLMLALLFTLMLEVRTRKSQDEPTASLTA